jgi:hypothetical protein
MLGGRTRSVIEGILTIPRPPAFETAEAREA